MRPIVSSSRLYQALQAAENDCEMDIQSRFTRAEQILQPARRSMSEQKFSRSMLHWLKCGSWSACIFSLHHNYDVTTWQG
jgi:hypothetical protein